MNIVLDIEIRAPMADLRRALKFGDLKNGVFIIVVHKHRLLMLRDKLLVGGGRNVVVWAIGDGCTTLGDRSIESKVSNVLGGRVRMDRRRRGPDLSSAHSRGKDAYTPYLGALNRSVIRTQHKKIGLVLQTLGILLGCSFRPGMCGMCLNRLEHDVNGCV
jgi:hypothetical protein